MNLSKLFDMQRKLDERIGREHPPQPGEDRMAKKILALQVELGELANEWRGFKFWSNDQEPRSKGEWIRSTGIENGKFIDVYKNPLLEEYVDCLHFILSIGNSLENMNVTFYSKKHENLLTQFIEIQGTIYELIAFPGEFGLLLSEFIGLGEMLGFKWEEIEEAYIQKNEVNFARQDNGY
ncbi:dUTP diphosphatase [Jeotgalibacillus aurantiacus]|uniref:dUTP diphosphatase n=1 Tax=Jeotgalibacillus aurantiacus TaxID=2763266 RepID=UPI001D0B0B5F|nr:dUTP diphosphatase [Jeotgalibacillus aurantiacus]